MPTACQQRKSRINIALFLNESTKWSKRDELREHVTQGARRGRRGAGHLPLPYGRMCTPCTAAGTAREALETPST